MTVVSMSHRWRFSGTAPVKLQSTLWEATISYPRIIQGGMGAGVSGWALARAVSQRGQLGVVSGTGIASILTRRLQAGDPGGHIRRALQRFPVSGAAARILDKYFVPGGKRADLPFKA